MENGDKQEILQAIAALDVSLSTKMEAFHDEAMEAIQMLSSSTDERFNELDAKIDGVEQRLDAKIDGVEQRLDAKIERTRVEMPTKDYLDRKFADYDHDASERADRMFVRR